MVKQYQTEKSENNPVNILWLYDDCFIYALPISVCFSAFDMSDENSVEDGTTAEQSCKSTKVEFWCRPGSYGFILLWEHQHQS